MGSAWSNVMNDPVQSQHYMGKVLKYLGPDNIVWGTDCILGGSPQSQIEAFKVFQISTQYQEMYGYPALTHDMKAKIFGLNAARIYHVDPAAARCKANASTFASMKRDLDDGIGGPRMAAQSPPRVRPGAEVFGPPPDHAGTRAAGGHRATGGAR